MSGAQFDILKQFYADYVEFTISDAGLSGTYRFLSPPAGEIIVGNSDPDKRIWNVQIEIERLP